MTMMSPSPVGVEQQFQSFEQLSNLDHCNRCGAPRSVHGPDWSCTTRSSRRAYTVPLISGGLLTLAGVILSVTVGGNRTAIPVAPGSDQASGPATLAAIAILVGVTLLVIGAVMARRLG
ncbi:MAG: hypothetical protein ABSF03_32685 [Streptosporangiaceae bacterium]